MDEKRNLITMGLITLFMLILFPLTYLFAEAELHSTQWYWSRTMLIGNLIILYCLTFYWFILLVRVILDNRRK